MAYYKVHEMFKMYVEKLLQIKSAPGDALIDFKRLENLEDKVRYCLNLLERSNCLPPKSLVKPDKDETMAEAYRLVGNHFFVIKEYAKALELYNQSLCFCEKGSEAMGMAYTNRSVIYFKTQYYKICLENVELALENGYPEKFKFKLIKRKNDCNYEIQYGRGKEMKHCIEPQLSYLPHPTIPQMVEGIELKQNKKYGRHLVAKQDFNPGDILMIENPLNASLYLQNIYKYCLNCLNSNLMSLLPCEEAVTGMFCSKRCYEESMSKYFKYEHQIIDAINGMLGHKTVLLRFVFELITLVKDMDGLKEFVDSLDSNQTSPFDIDYKNTTKKDLLRSYFTLESHEKSRPMQYQYELATEVAAQYYFAIKCTDLGQLVTTKDHEDMLMKLLFRMSMIASINFRRLDKISTINEEDQVVEAKAEACQLLICLMNHSCAANVDLIGENNHVIHVARPIKAGEQLFLTHGQFFYCTPRTERKQELKRRFLFDCTCIACEKNYPQDVQLSVKNLNCYELRVLMESHQISTCKVNDPKALQKVVKKCYKFTKKHDRSFPCLELYLVQYFQHKCSALLYAEEPLEVTFST